ncbi:tail fiber protein [Pseudomonas veronii]|uniref:Tail fiber protein n=1 Tax=Pseudomonas veronii TaxID=76761 RepID=A0ABS0VMZ8_PSEVE|nr:phage tail protein [Pseudomonas veronii]MBI6554686.1 tail fiber protein [Pseudomonas veronii]MBI6652911.1 tail fiber protein [Pseudomonas veronii]
MSLKLNERYPGRFNNPSAGYPGGSFKNRTTPTAKDGSYLEKDWANDKEGFFQSLLSAAGITANGAVDAVGASQFFDALQALKQIQAGTAFTTAGSAGALTLTPTPAISAYSAPQRFRVKFSRASTGSDTLNISGLGVKSIKQYNSTGAKVAAVFALNQLADVEYDGTDMVVLDPLPSAAVQATESVSGIAKIATSTTVGAGTNDTDIVTALKLSQRLSVLTVAPGAVQAFASNSAPSGYLKANGAIVSRTTYAALFNAIGSTFGGGDGSTTFQIPDLRGEFVRGWDDGRGVDAARAFGSLQLDAFQGHWHQNFYNAQASIGSGGNAYAMSVRAPAVNSVDGIADAVRYAISDGVNGTPRTAAETRSRNVALLYCIKI